MMQRRKRQRVKRRRQRGGVVSSILSKAALAGLQLGRSKEYRRLGTLGATGLYNR